MNWKIKRHGIYYLLHTENGTVSYHGIHKYEIESDTPGLFYYGETKGCITNDIFEGVSWEKQSASTVNKHAYDVMQEHLKSIPEIGPKRLQRILPVTVHGDYDFRTGK